MWIRSQNGTKIIKAENIVIENMGSYYNIYVNKFNVGRYEKEDRALQVLNEIESFLLKSTNIYYQMPEE